MIMVIMDQSSQGKLCKPAGFWTKRSPYLSSKYSNLEKLAWLLFEALKATEPLTGNTLITIGSQIPVVAWARLSPEEVAGVTLN